MVRFNKCLLPAGDPKLFRKKGTTAMWKIDVPFEVETLEGVMKCEDGFLALDMKGNPYPINSEVHKISYTSAEDDGPTFGTLDLAQEDELISELSKRNIGLVVLRLQRKTRKNQLGDETLTIDWFGGFTLCFGLISRACARLGLLIQKTQHSFGRDEQ